MCSLVYLRCCILSCVCCLIGIKRFCVHFAVCEGVLHCGRFLSKAAMVLLSMLASGTGGQREGSEWAEGGIRGASELSAAALVLPKGPKGFASWASLQPCVAGAGWVSGKRTPLQLRY